MSFLRRKTMRCDLKVLMLALALLSAAAESADSSAERQKLYKSKCAACHAADGSGDTPIGKKMKTPDLRSADVQQKSDAELTEVVASGKGKMAGFAKSLGMDQIGQLVAYVRELGAKH